MHTRSRAAATALLLVASASGLAATSGSAQAIGSHHGGGAARAATLTVTITTTQSKPKLSTETIRPGKTIFKVVRGSSGGLIQLLRLKSGYSLQDAFSDFAAVAPSDGNTPPDVHAIRRIDKNVVFYGGMETPAKGDPASKWGVDVDQAGTYYVVNLDKNNLSPLQAKGHHQKRSLPSTGGYVNMKTTSTGANAFSTPKNDPHKGWMKTTNNAAEPHFVVMDRVKKNTTKKDIENFLSQTGPPPFSHIPAELDTGVVSPGHTFVWKYRTPRGRYLTWCFWPSKTDGTPHAFMGMFTLINLV